MYTYKNSIGINTSVEEDKIFEKCYYIIDELTELMEDNNCDELIGITGEVIELKELRRMKGKFMNTLALDLSTKSSGYAIYKEQELDKYGCITAGSANLYRRIDKMIEELDKILNDNQIDRVIIEEVLPEDVKNNQDVFKALMYLQGFVMHLLDKHKIDKRRKDSRME